LDFEEYLTKFLMYVAKLVTFR